MFTFKGFPVKKITDFLPEFLRSYFTINRALTRLSREWVFSIELDTPVKRRRAAKQAICQRAEALKRNWQDLLLSVDAVSRLPAMEDEAYHLKLLLDSVVLPTSVDVKEECTERLAGQRQQVVLTVIMRFDEGDLPRLFASLKSLIAQRCSDWEVKVITSNAEFMTCLPSELIDSRIHCVVDEEQAFQQSSGSLVHELRGGDHLHADTVDELSRYLSDHENTAVLYVDHDHLAVSGERCQPVFKPDWNPDLFAAYDYIGSAVFVRLEHFLGQESKISQVGHIPKVLYHYNIYYAESGAQQRKSHYLSQQFLASLSASAQAKGVTSMPGLIPGSTRWQYRLPARSPKVSLIIPTRDGLEVLKPCVESILHKTRYANYELIIVDNQSADPETLLWLEKQGQDARIKVIQYHHLFNYSAINNFAVRYASGEIIGLINNDVEVISPGWLEEMVMHAWRPEIGCVGAKLYYGDGGIQHAGVILGANCGTAHGHRYFDRDADGYCGRLKLVQNVSAVTGACLLLRRELFEQVGGFEEGHLKIAYNDIDLCLKVREVGYRNLWTPYAELYHHESVSRGRDVSSQQRKRYQAEKAWMEQRWGERLWRDPYYNPNLTAARENFSLNMLHGL